MSNITQVVNTGKNLRTIKKGIHGSDMDQVLSSSGPYTLFAPSDLAFEKLERGLMDKMLEPQNRAELADLMKNHIVSGKVLFKDLKDGDILKTINNKELLVQAKDGTVSINNVAVQQIDTKVSNGVIYSLDTVFTK